MRRGERGSAAVFVLGMSIVLLACAGLVVDGGLAINARMRVADDAEQASRIAADTIDVDTLRDGGAVVVDVPAARARAASYLAGRGYAAGQFDVEETDDGSIRVRVRDVSDTKVLSIIAVPPFEVSASAVAEPRTGP